MEKVNLLKKSGVIGIIVLFICASFVPSIGGYSEETNQVDIDIEDVCESQENVLVTCRTFGFPGEPSQEITMSLSDAEFLYNKIKELQIETARDPLSDKTQQLQHEIITLADEHDLLPAGLSAETLKSRLTPTLHPQHPRITLPRLQNRASEMFCNYVSTGSGTSLPIIILPRLIPILLTPIPRLFVRWSTYEGITSCGGLRSGTGFIAYGAQNGIALGFWGIGFSIFLPPVMAYGLFGYALFASVNAEEIELWPPNNPPVISNENPPSGTWNAPVSLSELSFQIEDADGDPMSYSVTTDPDIGSGSGTNKGDGVYTIPVSGLKSSTQYRWTVEVADSEDVTMQEFSFMTEELPFDPFEEGWQYRKQITIDHTQVAGDLNYFPVLVSTVDNDLRDKTQEDGDDILFMDGHGVANKLYHELERFDGSSGELITWVNTPSLSSTVDTSLYLYYGNPNSGSQQMPERVWSTHYSGIWHLDDLHDSSSNTNDGSNHGTISILGQIGNARSFDGNNDHITVSDDPSLNFHNTNQFSIGLWMKRDQVNASREKLISKATTAHNAGYDLEIRPNNTIRFGVRTGSEVFYMYSTTELIDANWHHIAAIWDDGSQYIYVDGEFDKYKFQGDFSIKDDHKSLEIGIHYSANQPFKGCIDEIYISDTPRSASWIKTSYNNQYYPSSFLGFGPEETGP
ncbi:MAG: DUF2341 domain-containing protein [Thermoplasmatales archaeon]|nr:DUF2341 domain-containing protein [Thermoplasmatales archaeon]